jgi:hypothetical protein
MTASPSEYVVVARATSAAQFPAGRTLKLDLPEGTAVLETEYITGAGGLPLGMRGTLRGQATSVSDAQRRMTARLSSVMRWMGLVGNAAQTDTATVVAHGVEVRDGAVEFVAYGRPADVADMPPKPRTIHPDSMAAFIDGLNRYGADSAEAVSLYDRAVGNYCQAVRYWIPEQVLLAGEYLWLATEALSRAMVEVEAARCGLNLNNLARKRGIAKPALYPAARGRIFDGHPDALTALSEASEGFEHGYADLDSVRSGFAPVLSVAARCVRRALITELSLPPQAEVEILDPSRDDPLPIVPEVHRFLGQIRAIEGSTAPDRIEDVVEAFWGFGPVSAGPTPGGPSGLGRDASATLKNAPPGMEFSGVHRVRSSASMSLQGQVITPAAADGTPDLKDHRRTTEPPDSTEGPVVAGPPGMDDAGLEPATSALSRRISVVKP